MLVGPTARLDVTIKGDYPPPPQPPPPIIPPAWPVEATLAVIIAIAAITIAARAAIYVMISRRRGVQPTPTAPSPTLFDGTTSYFPE